MIINIKDKIILFPITMKFC